MSHLQVHHAAVLGKFKQWQWVETLVSRVLHFKGPPSRGLEPRSKDSRIMYFRGLEYIFL